VARLRFVVPTDVDRPTGGNAYDVQIAEALSRLGFDVELVRAGDAQLASLDTGTGFTLIDGLLASHRPDVVGDRRAGVLIHMPLAWRSPDQARLERETLQAASLVVATSHWTARFLLEEYAVRAVVVTPGVDPAAVEPGSDPPLIVQVATLAPHKDQLAVVRALGALTHLPWRARLVGSQAADPAYAAEVTALVAEEGLADRIDLPGTLSRDQAFAGANLLLLPSRMEAYGMVITEALARGIPAIVSPGGPAEALGATAAGDLPGAILTTPPATLETTLRHWLTSGEIRDRWAQAALVRRAELTPWSHSAAALARALDTLH
jgi:glycosyltransferase involved in cell wall biosynthesis